MSTFWMCFQRGDSRLVRSCGVRHYSEAAARSCAGKLRRQYSGEWTVTLLSPSPISGERPGHGLRHGPLRLPVDACP